jgi:hypothetical protein
MKNVFGHLVPALLMCLLMYSAALAQSSTAQISGTVSDQSNAILPGVEVSATQTETGLKRSTVTNEAGTYVLPNLPVGPYRLEASLPGFRSYVQTGIVLQVGSNPVVNVLLEVGQVAETVEVQANTSLVETQSTGISQVIENQRILELPLNGRQATDLIVLAGSAVNQGAATSLSMTGGVRISVAGGQSFGVQYLLDGARHNNAYDNLNMPLPFPDALQEFRVETSATQASNGGHSGAAVNAVTKSGTNEYHGDVFEFVRNYLFNARNAFALRNESLKRNQFGGIIGGPIRENTLFFFAGYQGTTTRQDPNDTQSFVPTAAMLAGDFTTYASGRCNSGGVGITLRGNRPDGSPIFVGNRTDPALFSKAALYIASKLPKTDDPCGLVTWGSKINDNEAQAVGRIDYQRGAADSFFGRYMLSSFTAPPPYELSPENVLTSSGSGRDHLAQSVTLGHTHLFGAGTVNAFRLAFNRAAVHRTKADFFSGPDAGINMYSYEPHYMTLAVTNGFSLGGATSGDYINRITSYSAGDNLSLVRGSHQLSLGGDLEQWRVVVYSQTRSPANITFDGTAASGRGLPDFLLGRPSQFLQAAPNTLFARQWYTALYLQDVWKASRRLTVNAGIRWEPWWPMAIPNKASYTFDYDRFTKGIKSTVFVNAPAGLYYPGDPDYPGLSGMHSQPWNFQPRLGIALDPTGSGKTSIRAAYGLSHEYVNGAFFQNGTIAPPWGSEVRLFSPAGGLDNPFLDFPGGNIFPVTFDQNARFSAYGGFLTHEYDTKTTQVHNWNLSIQRQLQPNWLVSASYIGNQTAHLWSTRALNPARNLGFGPCTLQGVSYPVCTVASNINQRRTFSLTGNPDALYLGAVDIVDDGGTQSYNGLQLSTQSRFGRGVNINANYTWSHCIGIPTGGGGLPNLGTNYVDINNRDFERGNCGADRRHIFNLTAVAETPQFSNRTLRLIGSSWRLSTIWRTQSGSYLTIGTGLDQTLDGTSAGSQRPNQILENPYGDKSLNNYLNRQAFRQPDPGTIGKMGRANILGPGTWSLDMALSRSFPIGENDRVEFRVEAFNVSNSLRPGNPNTSLNSNQFGRITSALDPRIMQFAVKFVF